MLLLTDIYLGVGIMYPKRKDHILIEMEDFEFCTDEDSIDQGIEEGDLNPVEAAILRGNLKGSRYIEEEE